MFVVFESPGDHFVRKMGFNRPGKIIVREPGQPSSHM